MKKIYIYILMAVALIALTIMLLMLSPWLNIENIEITGINRLEEAQLIRDFELDKETNILAISRVSLKKKVKNNFYIENISLKKTLPNSISINIEERQMAGYVPYINDFLYIDKEGRVIDIQPNYKWELPIIEGLGFDNFTIGKKLTVENKETFAIVMEITNLMSEKEILQNIVKIDMSNIEDIHLYINNIDVVFGNSENLRTKINTLDEILKNFSIEEKGFLYINDIKKAPIFKFLT